MNPASDPSLYVLRDKLPRLAMYKVLGNIKKGLLLSDCVEQKAGPGMALLEELSSLTWRFSWFLRLVCATSPHHTKAVTVFAKPLRRVSLFRRVF